MNNLTIETEDTFANLLEVAANNDVEGLKKFTEDGFSGTSEVGLWYSRQKDSKQMVLLHRTPLMVASTYGSIDVLKLIISFSNADLNKPCGVDKATALHCAASGGSINCIDVVKLLLEAGADPNCVDANGNFPIDVIVTPPKLENLKKSLEELLRVSTGTENLSVSTSTSTSNSPPLSPENGSPSSPLDSNSNSPDSLKISEILRSTMPYVSEKKEYPIDPSLPDIKNGIYSTDEFRMFSFKVRPCSRAYSHDWTECPFVHPGENARRRDPRKYHYSCVPCPDFRKGACRRGDMCEYAHGVFESWLHPAQYRTRICKDGSSCDRRVCFFAHKQEELRPLYLSTGSAVPSPRSNSGLSIDPYMLSTGSAVPSPRSNSGLSIDPYMLSPSSPFGSPLSPSGSGMFSGQNVPALQLPGSVNFQSSRLRSSLNARDIQGDDVDLFLNELSRLSSPSKGLNPSNLDNLFMAESSSPRYAESSAVFSPISSSFSPKPALHNQFQQHKNMLSPISTSFSSKSMDRSFAQSPFAGPSMSPQGVDHNLSNVKQEPISPMGHRVSMLREKQPLNFRSLSSRDLGCNHGDTGGHSWTNWGATGGKADWTVNADEFGKLRRSSSFELKNNMEEPDFGWVHSLVREENHQVNGGAELSGDEPIDQTVLGAWIEQMRFD